MNQSKPSILIYDVPESDRERLRDKLIEAGYKAEIATSPECTTPSVVLPEPSINDQISAAFERLIRRTNFQR